MKDYLLIGIFFMLIILSFLYVLKELLYGGKPERSTPMEDIQKIIIPENSILRKIVLFKDPTKYTPYAPGRFKRIPLLYSRVIPYLIHWILMILSLVIFFSNQYGVKFMPTTGIALIGCVILFLPTLLDGIYLLIADIRARKRRKNQ